MMSCTTASVVRPWLAAWGPSQMRIYRDGALIRQIDESSSDVIPDAAHFLTIQLDAWNGSLPNAVSMQVDYAKIWSRC